MDNDDTRPAGPRISRASQAQQPREEPGVPRHAEETVRMDEYEIEISGVTHTVLLTEDDAHRLGAVKAATPRNKQARPANKSEGDDGAPRILQ